MPERERFPYVVADNTWGDVSLLPLVPLVIAYQERSRDVQGLLDTGSTVNVLPYRIGLELGATWDRHAPSIRLTGALAHFEARPLTVSGTIGQFATTRLIFARTQAESIPLILGQVNFFMEFDVCFYRSQSEFEVQPRQ